LVEKGGEKVCETRVGGDVLLVLCEGLVVERVERCSVGNDQVMRIDRLESVVQAHGVWILGRSGV